MDPDQSIRTRLKLEHDALGRELERTEALASEYRLQGLQLLGPLEAQVKSLLEQLRKHMDWEDTVLPVADRFARQHREQRELLESLVADLSFDVRPPVMISTHIAAIAGLLRKDFLEEELELSGEGSDS